MWTCSIVGYLHFWIIQCFYEFLGEFTILNSDAITVSHNSGRNTIHFIEQILTHFLWFLESMWESWYSHWGFLSAFAYRMCTQYSMMPLKSTHAQYATKLAQEGGFNGVIVLSDNRKWLDQCNITPILLLYNEIAASRI